MTPAIVIATLIVAIVIVLTLAREYALFAEDLQGRPALLEREARRPKKKAEISVGRLLKAAAAGFAAAAIALPVGVVIGTVAILLALAWFA